MHQAESLGGSVVAHKQNTDNITKADIDDIRRVALGAYISGAIVTLETSRVANLKGRDFLPRELAYGWPDERVKSPIPPGDVQVYCNQDAEWQAVRLAMKGMNTLQKLIILDWWFMKKCREVKCVNDSWRLTVQTSNYITALRRGGVLTLDNWIIK